MKRPKHKRKLLRLSIVILPAMLLGYALCWLQMVRQGYSINGGDMGIFAILLIFTMGAFYFGRREGRFEGREDIGR